MTARRVRAAAPAAALVAVVLAGCGAGGGGRTPTSSRTRSGTTGTTTATSTSTTRGRSAPARRVVHGPRVGARQAVVSGGAHLVVTVRAVLALHGTGSPVLPGDRQVGVLLRIANLAGETYDSTASGDVSLVLSTGAAQPLFVKRGVCTTPLVDFESLLGTGVVREGCVGFSVPRRARVIGVRFSPHSRARGTLSWRALS